MDREGRRHLSPGEATMGPDRGDNHGINGDTRRLER